MSERHSNPYFQQPRAESEADLLRVHSPRPSRIASDFEHFRPHSIGSFSIRNKSSSSLNNVEGSEEVNSQTRLVDPGEQLRDSDIDRKDTIRSAKSFSTLSQYETNATDASGSRLIIFVDSC